MEDVRIQDSGCNFRHYGLSSICYTKQTNKERYWIAWTQNGRVIRWGSFCERLKHELEDIPSLALW